MPRPYPPPPVSSRVTVQPFALDDFAARAIARVLGLPTLPPDVSRVIVEAIMSYKATEAGSAGTTVGNTRAALAELKKHGRTYDKAVARFADDRSGVDYRTHGILQPLAKAVLANEAGAREALARAADLRDGELLKHKRVETAKEPLRFFCGVLCLIFNQVAAPELRPSPENGWRHCRQFAMEVFTAAGIDHADFDAHPERLTGYLDTDVTV